MKKILILASNPKNALKQIDREIRDLKKVIERNKNSKKFDVEIELAVNIEDLDELLYDNQPYIVHFCGHGVGKKGLLIENQEGVEKFLSNEALSNLFKNFRNDIQCVILNACSTEIQADIIVEHIPYVIGTSREILDKAAYYFSVGFYKGLVREQSIEVSYEWGCMSVQRNMQNIKIESHIDQQSRRMELVSEQDSSNVASEPLKIILKCKTVDQLQATKLSVNIPSEVEKEIIEEGYRKKYYDNLRNVLDRFGQTTIEREKLRSKLEDEQCRIFLGKVHHYWIDGFLKPSLYFNIAIDKGGDDPSGQISRPLTNLEVIRVDIDQSYDELQQTDVMDQIGGGKTLLILGEPGSGKTIALLQLAERLIEDLLKKQIPNKPIPVVFNLSSWEQKQSLKEWLIQELQDKYQVPQSLSRDWIKQEQLILLLDGLDEVGAKLDREKAIQRRNNCVKAIKKFIAEHLKTEIVVCSRVNDYKDLTEKLELSSAICIQPLSKQQLLEFLKNINDSLSGLKTVIEQDHEIAEFAQTPLILNMMTWTYQDWSPEECRKQFRIAKDRLDNLFESYIDKNLAQENKKEKYPKEQVLHWLGWLAKQMSQSVFQIEEIQPQWLPSQKDKIIYYIVIGLILGVLIGLISGIYFVYYYTISTDNKSIPEINILIKLIVIGMLSGLLPGVIVGLLSSRINRVIKWLISGTIFAISISFFDFFIYEKHLAILPMIMSALLGGGIFSSINTDIKPVESITLDFSKLFYYATNFGIFGIVYALIHLYLDNFHPKNGYQYSVYEIIIFIMVGVCFGGFRLQNRINQKTAIPNQGIEKSLRYTVITFWSLLFAAMFVCWGMDFSFYFNPVLICIGLVLGLLGGLGANESSGVVCIQHFTLRQMLHQKGRIPWDYAKFLDFASGRLLMKKVGGGYVFYHRMLLEYFARMIED